MTMHEMTKRVETIQRTLNATLASLKEREQIRRDMEWIALAQSTR